MSFTDVSRGGPSSRLEKKQMVNSWKRHALCNSVLSYESWTRYKEQYVEPNMVDL